MAKENREAEHMLGHNDPKQNKHQKKEKKRDTNGKSMSTTKTQR